MPTLICTSFSDNALHSGGSFRAFEHIESQHRFAYTHRAGKWAVFYGEPAKQVQLAFFDRFLRGTDAPGPARLRLEVRESRDVIAEVRDEQEWPLARTEWMPLHLSEEGRLEAAAPRRDGRIRFAARWSAAAFSYTVPEDLEMSGPMGLRLWVSVEQADDIELVAGVEKWRDGRYIGFEGSYGFGRDRVATGWQKASLRRLDEAASTPTEPVHDYLLSEPLAPGEIVPVEIAFAPSATLFRAGETIRLVVGGRWLWPVNPLTGQFPARYSRIAGARCTLHWGPSRPARLLVPRIPPRSS